MRTLKPIRQTGLKENMSELIAASYAKRTRIKYQRDLKKLREWLNGQKLMDETLSEYVVHLHAAGKSSSHLHQCYHYGQCSCQCDLGSP